MRTPKRAPTSSSSGYGSTPPARPDAAESTNPLVVRPASVPPPPPNTATRKLKRMPLQRMPTELVLTTRMLPVRMGTEHGSAVRPVAEGHAERGAHHAELVQPFDRMVTGPCLPRLESDEALLRAAAVSSAPSSPPLPVPGAAPRQRAAAVATQDADYAVRSTPWRQEAIDELPELLSDSTLDAAHEDHSRPPPSAARARSLPPAAPRSRSSTPIRNPPPRAHDTAHDELTQARQQLARAVETARKSEQRAREAELLAAWAERYVPQMQAAKPASGRHQVPSAQPPRASWLKRALQVSLVGLVVGGYVSLLGPVRERVVSQNATIQRLTELQEQMRSEQRELRERIEQEQDRGAEQDGADKAQKGAAPHDQRATRGKAVAR